MYQQRQTQLGAIFDDRKKDVIELDMSVDQALKYIISMGTVVPEIKSVVNAKLAKKPNNPKQFNLNK